MHTDDLNVLADEELAQAVRTGATEAFGVLWERHAGAGRAAARRLTTSYEPDDMVQEAYLRILRALQSGAGPTGPFRPYLYTTLRSVAAGWARSPDPVPVEELPEVVDERDVATEVLERSVTARAFRRLPERWQSVLWYTEVEGMQPSEAAPLLGLSAQATAALAYRAREGLRREWLQAHVHTDAVAEDCRWTVERLADHARGGLSRSAQDRLEEHLTGCMACSILAEEVDDVASRLRLVLLPLVLGAPAALGATATATTAPATVGLQDPGGTAARQATASSTSSPWVAIGVALAVTAAAGLSAVALARPWDAGPSHVVASPGHDDEALAGPEVDGAAPVSPADAPALESPEDDAPSAADPEPHRGAPGEQEPTPRSGVGRTRDAGAPSAPPALVPPSTQDPGPGAPAPPPSPGPSDPPARPEPPAAPVVLEAPSAGMLTFFPAVRGTGVPGAEVRVTSTDGHVATTTVRPDGAWDTTLTGLAAAGAHTLTVAQEHEGQVSPPSTSLGPYTFELPRVVSPTPGATVTGRVQTLPGDDPLYAVDVELDGIPGLVGEAFVDGRSTGNLHLLGAQPLVRQVSNLAPGRHTFGLRYVDPHAPGTRFGPTTTVTFAVTGP